MVLKFRNFNNGRFSNGMLSADYVLFILDIDKNELYSFGDILADKNYLSNRQVKLIIL